MLKLPFPHNSEYVLHHHTTLYSLCQAVRLIFRDILLQSDRQIYKFPPIHTLFGLVMQSFLISVCHANSPPTFMSCNISFPMCMYVTQSFLPLWKGKIFMTSLKGSVVPNVHLRGPWLVLGWGWKSPMIFHFFAYVIGVFLSFSRMHLSGEVYVLKKRVTSRYGTVCLTICNF